MGNSVIVVEHDKDMMLAADYVIDMGPKAGRLSGSRFQEPNGNVEDEYNDFAISEWKKWR